MNPVKYFDRCVTYQKDPSRTKPLNNTNKSNENTTTGLKEHANNVPAKKINMMGPNESWIYSLQSVEYQTLHKS